MGLKNPPYFSVVIPTYNRARLVVEAVESVLNQTFSDFEVMVVDNGSTDNTSQLISDIGDSRVKYLFRDPTGGPAWPRNLGIENASGLWICFLDSDDIWYKDKLSTIKTHIEADNVEVVTHWQAEINGDGVRVKILKPDSLTLRDYKSMLVTENSLITSTITVKASFIREFNIRFKEDKNYIGIEDYDFWLKVSFHKGKISCTPFVLGEMRTPPMRTGTNDRFWENLPNLFYDHSFHVQLFEKRKRALYRRLLAGLALRKGFSAIRRYRILKAFFYFGDSMLKNPLEILRYLKLRIHQRLGARMGEF